MPSGSASFSSRPNFKLEVDVSVSGTSVTMTAQAVRTGSETTTPYTLSGTSATRTYSFSNSSAPTSGNAEWIFDFRPAGSSSSSNPYYVGVWSSGVTRTATSSGSVTVTASMSLLGSASVTVPYTIVTVAAPVISGSFTSTATLNSAYGPSSITATNSPSSWSLVSGSLPPGLSGSGSGGTYTISGTPTATGTYNFSIRAQNDGGSDTESFSITVSTPKPVISGSFSNGTVNVSYDSSVTATNDPTSWSRSGSLPPGLSGSGSGGTYSITGTPTTAGSYPFTLTATNAGGTSDAASFSIDIAAPPAPSWNSTAAFSDGKVGTQYYQTRTASNTTSITFATTNAPGLSAYAFGSSTLVLEGNPTASGTYSVSATANGQSGTTPVNLNTTVYIAPLVPPVWIDQTVSTTFIVGTPYSDAVSATNSPSYSVSSGSLPSGVGINSSTGAITGTPTTKQSFNFVLRAANNDGTIFTTSFSGTTTAPPVWIDQTLGNFLQGRAYSDGVSATSPISSSPTVYAVSVGTLPTGISLNTSTGAVTGTPTGTGSYSFTITATNADGTISANFSGTIKLPPNWTDNELGSFVETIPYADFVVATNSPTYTVSAGSLPSGITLNSSTGLVSGTPTTVNQAYSFTITATNSDGSVSQAFSGTVQPDLGGGIKVYSGTAWSNKELYAYDGTAWLPGKVYRFNGNIWVKSLF